MKKVLVMCLADISKNPRPNRIIKLLQNHGYIVDTYSYKKHGDLKVNKEYIIKYKKNSQIYTLTRQILRVIVPLKYKIILTNQIHNIKSRDIEKFHYDLIIVENIELLPLAIENRNGARILCDLREFYPKEFESSIKFKLLMSRFKKVLCNKYLKECDALITVSNGLKNGYKKYFNVNPELVRSTPYFIDILPSKVNSKEIKMVHHGNANRDRKLENLINIFEWLDNRFSLDFYLVGSSEYISELKQIANKYPQIKFQNPVALDKIVETMNRYDIGLAYFEPITFNLENAAPNKFFEYIQARLAIAIGPSYDMKLIMDKYELGVVADDFSIKNLAKKLNNLSKNDISKYKVNSCYAAKELCYEKESEKILNLLKRIT